eukprot:GHVU01010791.1.p1 GENE.GHVU01010791.1~~GHVU01010791.1.p1  ORF type:complete len:334 (+),score=17.25 GHVU01010791.1:2047-3048(+)
MEQKVGFRLFYTVICVVVASSITPVHAFSSGVIAKMHSHGLAWTVIEEYHSGGAMHKTRWERRCDRDVLHHRMNSHLLPLERLLQKRVVDATECSSFCAPKVAGRPALIACSGGSDSMALLHMLGRIKLKGPLDFETACGVKLRVVHFRHRIRDDDKDDAVVVKETCRLYDFPFVLCVADDVLADEFKRANPRRSSQRFANSSIEAKCAQWRISKAREFMDSLTLSKVGKPSELATVEEKEFEQCYRGFYITAHHLNDAAEKMILKLVRGVHLSNWTYVQCFCGCTYTACLPNLQLWAHGDLQSRLTESSPVGYGISPDLLWWSSGPRHRWNR